MHELINIKTDYFTNNSQTNLKENYTTQNENVEENSSSNEERILNKHNSFLFYKDEKEKNLNFESDFYLDKNTNKNNKNNQNLKNQNAENVNLENENGGNFENVYNLDFAKNKLENINISSINPIASQINNNLNKRKSKANRNTPNQHTQTGKNFLMRNDSFSLPRTNSKKYIAKHKK